VERKPDKKIRKQLIKATILMWLLCVICGMVEIFIFGNPRPISNIIIFFMALGVVSSLFMSFIFDPYRQH
jgi:hypothetical protein